MRIVFTGDTHIGADHPLKVRTPRRHRGPDFLANLERVIAHATEKRADLFLHGGDFFDGPNVADALVTRAYAALFELAEHGVHVGLVAGNHERSSLPPHLWLQHPRIHVFAHAHRHVFHTGGGSVDVLGIPFVRGDVQNLLTQQALAHGNSTADLRLMMFHQPVEGATVGVQNYVFRSRVDTIPLANLPLGFDAFLSGHIHRAQLLWSQGHHGIPVVYAGSVERTSFAERLEAKGFVELQMEGGKRRLRRHPLPARPMVEVPVQGTTRSQVEEALWAQTAGLPADAVVRLMGSAQTLALINGAVLNAAVPAGISVCGLPVPRLHRSA